MRLAEAFDAIEVGEIDGFAFNFTRDVGQADIVATQWTCITAPFSAVLDLEANTRVALIGTGAAHQIPFRGIDGSLQFQQGFFGVALVGPMPAAMAGATYILDCLAYLSDGRKIALNSTVQCVLMGQ